MQVEDYVSAGERRCDLERDLGDVGVVLDIASALGLDKEHRDGVDPVAVGLCEPVTQTTRPTVELCQGGGEKAATGEDVALGVRKERVDQRDDPTNSWCLPKRGLHDLGRIDIGSELDRRELQFLYDPKWAKTPLLLIPRRVASRPIVSPPRPSTDARSAAARRIAARVRSPSERSARTVGFIRFRSYLPC